MMAQAMAWTEQWDRVERWYSRVKQTNDGRVHDLTSDHYQDEAYAFFQNAYHLKDWLKNDRQVSARVADVETFVSSSQSMRLCADLCNGSKHFALKTPRESADTKIGQRHFKVGLSEPVTISARYTVESAGQTYDAFELAHDCLEEWRAYLVARGVLVF
jgi:hypothetical protein